MTLTFVTFTGGGWQSNSLPKCMSECIAEHIKPNSDEVFEQVSVSQTLDEWYLRTNKRWWHMSSILRNSENKYKTSLAAGRQDWSLIAHDHDYNEHVYGNMIMMRRMMMMVMMVMN